MELSKRVINALKMQYPRLKDIQGVIKLFRPKLNRGGEEVGDPADSAGGNL